MSAYDRACYVWIALINKAKIFRSVTNSSPNHALIISLLPLISHVLRDIAGIFNLEGLCLLLAKAVHLVVYIQPNLIEKVLNKKLPQLLK